VFENQGKLFEVLLVACSATEAGAWRDRICGRIAVETKHLAEGRTVPIEINSPLTDDMRSVGKAYGRCNEFTRRLSVHRAATLGPTTDLNQVMIKNTQAAKEAPDNVSTSSLPIPRSQSVATPSHIPVLTPRRTDRIQLEHILADVWTKDAIPWPGLGPKRSEYNIRASANHVIRKLSMASIASNFSKRSMSYASVSQASIPEMKMSKTPKPQKLKGKPPLALPDPLKPNEQKPLINFHTAPDAFLPEDFDLKTTLTKGRKLGGLRTLTMTAERPRTPFFTSENRFPELRRAKSVANRPSTSDQNRPKANRTLSPQPFGGSEDKGNLTFTVPVTETTGNAGTERLTTRKRAKSKLMKLLG